jgi:hypothetical protein
VTTFERLAIQTALEKMLHGNYFDICTVDNVLKITRTVPDGRVYNALRLLHCIHYRDMPRELLVEIPGMLAEVFRGPLLEVPHLNFVSDSADGRPRLVVRQA